MIIHTVRDGESLREVAAEYEVSPLKLGAINGISGTRLIPGEELLVLIPTRTANVRRGESLSSLARRFGVKESSLIAINPELFGTGSVYDGQPITVKYGSARYGLGIGNGYFYRGASREQLMRALPYLSYVTVCSAVARRGGVSNIFDDSEAVALARAAGKLPLMRLYLDVGERLTEELMCSAALMAETKGYYGITISAGGGSPTSKELNSARPTLSECGLKLALECDADLPLPECGAADMTVLTYDKIHLEPIPSFDEGEGRVFRHYAQTQDAVRAFIDLSPFALVGGKYITKAEARDAVMHSGASLSVGADGGTLFASSRRRGKERRWVMESLSNTARKLELISELGFYGIVFDIARCPISELMMFRTMFSESIGMR